MGGVYPHRILDAVSALDLLVVNTYQLAPFDIPDLDPRARLPGLLIPDGLELELMRLTRHHPD